MGQQRQLPKCEDFVAPVPPGLEDLLLDISKQVLTNKPQNIYCFIADYLEGKLCQGSGQSPTRALEVGDGAGKDEETAKPESLRQRLSNLQHLVKSSVDLGTKFAEKYRRAGELQLLPPTVGCNQDTDEYRLDKHLNVLNNLLSNMQVAIGGQEVNETGKVCHEVNDPNLPDLRNLTTESLDRLICQEVEGLLTQVRTMSVALEQAQQIAAALERLGIRRDQLSCRQRAKADCTTQANHPGCTASTQEANWTADNTFQSDSAPVPEISQGQHQVQGQEEAKTERENGTEVVAQKLCGARVAAPTAQPGSGIPLQAIPENHAFETVVLFKSDVEIECSEVNETHAADLEFPPPPDEATQALDLDQLPTGTCIGELQRRDAAQDVVKKEIFWPMCQETNDEQALDLEKAAEEATEAVPEDECGTFPEAAEAEAQRGCGESTAAVGGADASVEETEAEVEGGAEAVLDKLTDEAESETVENECVTAETECKAEETVLLEADEQPEASNESEQPDSTAAALEDAGAMAVEDAEAGATAAEDGEKSEEIAAENAAEPGEQAAESMATEQAVGGEEAEAMVPKDATGVEQPETAPEEAEVAKQSDGEAVSPDGTGTVAAIAVAGTEGAAAIAPDHADVQPVDGANGSAGAAFETSGELHQGSSPGQDLAVSESSRDEATFFGEQFGTLRQVLSGQRNVGDCGMHFILFGTGLLALVGYGAFKGIGRISAILSKSASSSPVSFPTGLFGSCRSPKLLQAASPSSFCSPRYSPSC